MEAHDQLLGKTPPRTLGAGREQNPTRFFPPKDSQREGSWARGINGEWGQEPRHGLNSLLSVGFSGHPSGELAQRSGPAELAQVDEP